MVAASPHLFEPAYAKDEAVRLELKIAGHLAERRTTRRSTWSRSRRPEGGPRRRVLPDSRQAKPFKLP